MRHQAKLKYIAACLLATLLLSGLIALMASGALAGLQQKSKPASTDTAPAMAHGRGERAAKAREISYAVKHLKLAAKAGSLAAELQLGHLYADGKGASKNYAEALLWYSRAAAEGSTPAMARIGDLYRSGHGVKKSYRTAAGWYVRAIVHGGGNAKHLTADLFAVCKQPSLSPALRASVLNKIRNAAVGGNANAMYTMGAARNGGVLAERSRTKALLWLRRAGRARCVPAMLYLAGRRYLMRLTSHQAPSEAAHDGKRAFYWFHRAALAGNTDAMLFASDGRIDGWGTGTKNFRAGLAWLRRAASLGQPVAMANIGDMYAFGQLPKNYFKALHWYKMASAAGAKKLAASDIKALNTMYRYGIFTKH